MKPPYWHRHALPRRRIDEFVFMGTFVEWRTEAHGIARLTCTRESDPRAADVGEFRACASCGRVTRWPRDNSYQAEHLKHYTDCTRARWQRCRPTSEAIGAPMEFCDGVEARRWRCGICLREQTEKSIDLRVRVPVPHPDGACPRPVKEADQVIGYVGWLHHKHCPLNPRPGPCPEADSLRRVREALGQQTLFGSEVPLV